MPFEKLARFHQRSIEDREGFWLEQADLIDWETRPTRALDFSHPPFARWFPEGRTNLCHNAIDRHLATRGEQIALAYVSTETGIERNYSYRELHREVQRCAAALQDLGVGQGDRVIIYMPMIAEAIFAMLACARIGAIHSVVFGGFAAQSLATRIDDARPKVMVTADAGMRGGRAIPYKPLVDAALAACQNPPAHVLIVDRKLDPDMQRTPGRDIDYLEVLARAGDREVPVAWLPGDAPSYILYTSGTTGKPKGVQRDTAGYAVALAASMRYIYGGKPGEAMFTTSDIGWVVGHSYIVYAPLIHGMTTVVYEGLPIRPDATIWWKLVERFKVSVMFSSPTAIRVLKKQDPASLHAHDTRSLRGLYLAGEPLDEPTARWISDALGVPVTDNYWQTETGWPILSAMPGVEETPRRFGSPSFPVYGFDVQLLDENGEQVPPGAKGVVAIRPPLPPGCLSTVWGDDQRFVQTYFSMFTDRQVYSSFDWGLQDQDGYWFILGRTDDVINTAGHRLGTREIEEAISAHTAVAEVAVVGVQDALKGQVPVAFVVLRDPARIAADGAAAALEREVFQAVDSSLGAIARPARVHFVSALPKTRSGKLLRRSIQALAEGRDAGDLTTLDDPAALEQVRAALAAGHVR
ncbi:MAG: propionate--CoA ligase [Pseudomonadota bacterium]|nr:propionate--CoA ligase [Pseudomonadota bacterium]